MDLNINGQLFIVTGASSGLGNAVARCLLRHGASVITLARRKDLLDELSAEFPAQSESLALDVTSPESINAVVDKLNGRALAGIFVNAGGPPAKSFAETELPDWDEAYRILLRWKVGLVKALLPNFRQQQYGRILFSESSTVKQPIENLVLSNSLRMAVAGAAKTLSLEVAKDGITVNLIGPGFHETKAIDRIFKKKSELEGISEQEAREQIVSGIPMGKIGDPEDFASLAAWLLSPLSGFVSGQVWSLDGGNTRFSLG